MERVIILTEQLSALKGVSGNEHQVREYIIDKIKNLCEYSIDPVGNIIAFKKGKKASNKKVMFSAHMDEVGFIITYIDDSGLLQFTNVGGIDSRVVIGKSVVVNGHYGVIGTKAVHMQTDAEKETPVKMDKLYIDIGATSKEDAEKYVSLGDRAVFYSEFIHYGDGFIKGKALDDRAGCAVLIDMIEKEIEYDSYFAFTVNEETGMQGAKTAAYTINPDISFVIETTTAADIAEVSSNKEVCRLSKGAVVSFMDRGTVYHFDLYNHVINTAKQNKIPCQSKQGIFGGNEARCIQTTRAGVKVSAISMPCRYLHSPSCVLKKEDILNTEKLLLTLISSVQEF